jgi:hypothetical protein
MGRFVGFAMKLDYRLMHVSLLVLLLLSAWLPSCGSSKRTGVGSLRTAKVVFVAEFPIGTRIPETFRIYDEGRRSLLIEKIDGKMVVTIDMEVIGKYESVLEGTPIISANGRKIAFGALKDDGWYVIANGKEYGPYKRIGKNSLKFSTDGSALAFVAMRDNLYFVVRNGIESEGYFGVLVDSLQFKEVTSDVVYGVTNGIEQYIVDGSKEGRRHAEIVGWTVTTGFIGQEIVYAAMDGCIVNMYCGRKKLKGDFAAMSKGIPLISPDGKRVFYCGAHLKSRKRAPFVNGESLGEYDGLLDERAVFSGDGKRIVFGVRKAGKWHVCDNGRIGKGYDGVMKIKVSKDGMNMGYLAQDGGRYFAVFNEEEGPRVNGVFEQTFVLSPDGKILLYAASQPGECVVYRNNEILDRYRGAKAGALAVNDDASIVAVHLQDEKGAFIAIRQRKSDYYEMIDNKYGSRLRFVGKTDFEFVALRIGMMFLIRLSAD